MLEKEIKKAEQAFEQLCMLDNEIAIAEFIYDCVEDLKQSIEISKNDVIDNDWLFAS